MDPPQALLDAIIDRLSKLPGTREFKASALISQPRKSPESLFPYAPNIEDKELYIQDVVLLVAERVQNPDAVVPTASATDAEPIAPADPAFVYVSALEAVLYIFPDTHSIIIYISKVDSTGQGKRPSPTRTLMLTFLEHVTNHWFGVYTPKHEIDGEKSPSKGWDVWIQLFARSQNQYLFPASIEHPRKRVLSDIGLVKWWKSVLDEHISDVVGQKPAQRTQASKYVSIPGLSPAETIYTLKLPMQATTALEDWRVGTPYSRSDIIFPLGVRPPTSISQLVPFFPDDPKARLIVEIANTTTKGAAMTPPRKRRKLDDGQAVSADEEEKKEGEDDEENGEEEEGQGKAVDYLRTVSAEEFWERMDGRQECRLGTVAFFTVHVGGSLFSSQTDTIPAYSHTHAPKRAEVPLKVVRKFSASLDSADFGSIEKSSKSTERLQDSIRALSSGVTVLTSTIPGIVDDALQETDGASTTEEQDLLGHIVKTVSVSNPELPEKTTVEVVAPPVVTVLAVRKKKKPAKA
ncbi:hypothetical protein M408DRAFT_328643, partial [Serendipita vermifera MAFF 305830]